MFTLTSLLLVFTLTSLPLVIILIVITAVIIDDNTDVITAIIVDDHPDGTTATLTDEATNESNKRGRDFLLLHDNYLVAAGIEEPNRSIIHGSAVNKESYAVLSVSEVFDSSFVPVEANPVEEPLMVGQFVLWKPCDMVENDDSGSRHNKHRLCARRNYLQ